MTGYRRMGSRCLISLTLILSVAACSPHSSAPPVVPSVFVSPVRNETGTVQRVLFGQVRPRVEADLGFRVGGKVTERLVELGQTVRAGQELARVDPVDYQLAVHAAEEQQRAAEVDAVQAASDAVRFRRLLVEGSVGAADAERQQARADAAAARLAQTQKQTQLARNREAYTVLTAPFDGVVTALRLEVGQMVDDRHSVLSIAKPNELEVLVDIPESLVPGLKGWQASVLVGDAIASESARPLPLRLRELAPSANAATRTTRARYALATPVDGSTWRMNMTAEVRLQRTGLQSGAELPLGALLVTPSVSGTETATPRNTPAQPVGPSVWLVDAETAKLRRQPVQLVSQGTDHVRVAGLADGELVVTVGAHKLDEGMKVQPVQRSLPVVHSTLPSAVTPAGASTMVTR